MAALGALLGGVFLLVAFYTEPVISARDEAVRIHATDAFFESGTLDFQREGLSESNLYHNFLATYRTADEAYFKIQIGSVLLYAPFSRLPGSVGFYLATTFYATFAVGALFLLTWRILESWWAALLAGLVFATSPVFLGWSVTIFDMVPVVGLELLGAYLLLRRPLTPVHAAIAALAVGAVILTRVQDAFIILPLAAALLVAARRWTSTLAFTVTLGGIAFALMAFNSSNYGGDPFYIPSVGDDFVSSTNEARLTGSGGLFSAYGRFLLGTEGSISEFDPIDWLSNLHFHAEYLATATFAFPFLYISGVGLLLSLTRPYRWTLLGGSVMLALLIILIYGNKSDNYFGYDEQWVRSSFIRYSLPLFAVLSIPVAAFGRDLYFTLRRSISDVLIAPALVGAICTIGIVTANIDQNYSVGRLNDFRRSDAALWRQADTIISDSSDPLILVGNMAKLVDYHEFDRVIQVSSIPTFEWEAELTPVIQANRDRDIFVLLAPSDQEFLLFVQERFTFDELWPVGYLELAKLGESHSESQ